MPEVAPDVLAERTRLANAYFGEGIPEHLEVVLRRQARRVSASSRGMADADDLRAEVVLWMMRRPDRIEKFLDPEEFGEVKRLWHSICYRRMQEFVVRERLARTGGKASDHYFYTASVVEELLPLAWEVSDRVFNVVNEDSPDVRRNRTMPSEGNTHAAAMADVLAALESQPEGDIEALRLRYHEGLTFDDLGALWGVTATQASRRIKRMLENVIDCLGGEAPWAHPAG